MKFRKPSKRTLKIGAACVAGVILAGGLTAGGVATSTAINNQNTVTAISDELDHRDWEAEDRVITVQVDDSYARIDQRWSNDHIFAGKIIAIATPTTTPALPTAPPRYATGTVTAVTVSSMGVYLETTVPGLTLVLPQVATDGQIWEDDLLGAQVEYVQHVPRR